MFVQFDIRQQRPGLQLRQVYEQTKDVPEDSELTITLPTGSTQNLTLRLFRQLFPLEPEDEVFDPVEYDSV